MSLGKAKWCCVVFATVACCLSSIASAAPQLQLSRSTVDFGLIGAGVRSSSQPVFLMNTGDASLAVSAIALSGAQASDFHVDTTCFPPVTLPPGARCRLDISVQVGSFSSTTRVAMLSIQSDTLPTTNIALRATYESEISRGFVPAPAFVDFIDVPLGTAASATLVVTNPEPSLVTIESVVLAQGDVQDFAVSSDCRAAPSGNGSACASTIVFTPTAAGPRSTTIEFHFHPQVAPTAHLVYRYSVTGIGTFGTNPGVVNANQQGVTGSWFQPSTDRQGIELEVFEDLAAPGVGVMQGSWFTFDASSGAASHNRWYTFGGAVQAGTNTVALPLYENTGGNFNALPVTSPVQVGTVSFTFIDCANARMSYAFTDTGRPNPVGTESLIRLTPNVLCAAKGSLAGPSDFGLSGNWYDAATSGQGVVLEVNPLVPAVFMAWYTYAVGGNTQGAAGQRWYTALASYTPGTKSIPLLLYETTGGILNSPTPTPSSTQVGTATLAFSSCSAARLTYSFTAGSNAGQAGGIDLARVGPVPSSCAI